MLPGPFLKIQVILTAGMRQDGGKLADLFCALHKISKCRFGIEPVPAANLIQPILAWGYTSDAFTIFNGYFQWDDGNT